MNALAELYAGQNFTILGFPCNQFGLQEPGATANEIINGIMYVRPGGGFEPNMTLFHKTEVNGADEDPIFTFLKSGCEYTDTEYSSGLYYEPLVIGDIHWNFEKFLIDKEGKPYTRYHPTLVTNAEITADIDALLSA